MYYFHRCSSELVDLVLLPYSCGRSVLVDLRYYTMSTSKIYFLPQLDPGILCLQHAESFAKVFFKKMALSIELIGTIHL